MKTVVEVRDVELVIKSNNYIARETCPVCLQKHKDSSTPEWIFPEDSMEGICMNCAKKECPDLLEKVQKSAKSFWK